VRGVGCSARRPDEYSESCSRAGLLRKDASIPVSIPVSVLLPSKGRWLGYACSSATVCNVELQLRALWDAGCADVWLDDATGVGDERPALDELRSVLRPGDVLVVWRLQCLARTLSDVLKSVRDFSAAGIGFCSVSEPFDTTTTSAVSITELFGVLVECEYALASERAQRGVMSARVRGTRMGRPAKIPGIDVDAAVALREQGSSMADIAAAFDVSRATLYRALKTHT
jgi:DNA invertase Pin-like site-specific DNA recombinase